jgi:phenol hydroxylase P1 protein
MTIEIKTTSVRPLRKTFDHIAAKIGPDKAATRYQEAVWGLQPVVNQHYRPTWQPEKQLYDCSRTAIVMGDFDDLVDPRQYYYGTWTIQRGKQQDSQEKNFKFVESRALMDGIDTVWKDKIRQLVIPLRHVSWGANNNNSYIAAYGFGAPVTSAAALHMMDHLGIAQYITRIGLIMDGNDPVVLDDAMKLWIGDPLWQPMRALVEESMVTKDWFELFVLQNLLIDGSIHPLILDKFDAQVAHNGGAAFSMMNEFAIEWFAESSRWVDAVLKRAAQESEANKTTIEAWVAKWVPRVEGALKPLSDLAFAAQSAAALDEVMHRLAARVGKVGLNT